jgi:hypothetical protein
MEIDLESTKDKFRSLISVSHSEKTGWYFNALTWNWTMRPGASILAGILLSVFVKVLTGLVVFFSPLNNSVIGFSETFLLAVLFAALFAMEDTDEDTALEVPPTMFALEVTWLGIPLNIYLMSSKYTWLGKRLGFGLIKKASEPFTNEGGAFKMGTIPFPVWNEPDAKKESPDRTYMKAPAKNDAEISGALTLIVKINNPRKLLDADEAARNLGDKARQEFRELTTKFVDTDVPKLHSHLKYLMEGKPLFTCFIGKPLSGFKVGSMVKDKSGFPVFEFLEDDYGEEAIKKAIKRLGERILDPKEVDTKMRNAVATKAKDGGEWTVRATTIKVSNPIENVLKEIGCTLHGMRFADIEFSDAVKKAAEQASAEEGENISQLASAATIKEARKKLMPTPSEVNNPGYELATVIAAAQDDKSGNIRIVMTPGGNALTSAAVAGASEFGGKSK